MELLKLEISLSKVRIYESYYRSPRNCQTTKALGDYDCNVIGMTAAIIAEEQFGMSKATTGTKTIDGYWRVNDSIESVQVKGWSCSRVARYKGGTFLRIPVVNPPDSLLIILFYSRLGKFEILY